MKILYTVSNPYGLGADRWIWEGYRDAFLAEGHEFFTLSEFDDFKKTAQQVAPDLLLLDFCFFERFAFSVPQDFFSQLKQKGTKIFCLTDVGVDREVPQEERIALFRKYLPFFDVCYSNYAPEETKGFEERFGKPLHFVPHAANTKYYFPDTRDPKFSCDIAFVGSFYTQKREQYDKLLFPLLKKYRVCLYGAGWTRRDRVLRLASGVARKLKLSSLARLLSKQRIVLSPDEERKLYASSKICVNIHEYYRDGTCKGFSNEREFKVPASGGFQITDYIPGMERYFDLEREIVAVKTPEDWFQKVDYYLTHERERKDIQERGTARVLREHTYRHRVRQLLGLMRIELQ